MREHTMRQYKPFTVGHVLHLGYTNLSITVVFGILLHKCLISPSLLYTDCYIVYMSRHMLMGCGLTTGFS